MKRQVRNKKFKNIKKNIRDFSNVFLWCLKISWEVSKRDTLLRIILQVISPLTGLVTTFLAKEIIDGISLSQPWENLRILLLLTGLISLSGLIISKLNIYIQTIQSEELSMRMMTDMMHFSLDVDLSYFDDPNYQNKLTSAMQDGSILIQSLSSTISVISSFFLMIVAFLLLVEYNVIYSIILVILAIPSGWAQKYYTESLYQLHLDQMNEGRKLSYIESIAFDRSMSQDLRLFDAQELLKEKHEKIWQSLFSERKRVLLSRSKVTLLLDSLPEITLVIMAVHIIFEISRGKLMIGDYIYLTGLLSRLLQSTSAFIASSMDLIENKLRMLNYKSLFSYTNKIADEGNLKLKEIESIEFKKVYFKYPMSEKYALTDINFSVIAPEHIAFVGLNGSGKSTLIKLLLRFYEPTSGEIMINNRHISSYSLESLREAFSVYFQDMNNFAFTLQENFQITQPNNIIDNKRVLEAMMLADIDEIIEYSSHGLDTYLSKFFSEEGLILSGGQEQKMALARTLYRKNSALILDEVSSNLDPEAENKIFKNLEKILQGRLTLFTSHRLTNLSLADRVIVLENGHIIEDGNPKELIHNDSRFAMLYRYQQQKYRVE